MPSEKQIYFIDLGVYDTSLLGELHQSRFYVAEDQKGAVARPHRDDAIVVEEQLVGVPAEDDAMEDVIEMAESDGFRLRLSPTTASQSFVTTCGYWRIDSERAVNSTAAWS